MSKGESDLTGIKGQLWGVSRGKGSGSDDAVDPWMPSRSRHEEESVVDQSAGEVFGGSPKGVGRPSHFSEDSLVPKPVNPVKVKKRPNYQRGFSTVRVDPKLVQAAKVAAEHMGVERQTLIENILRDGIKPLYLEALAKSKPISIFDEE